MSGFLKKATLFFSKSKPDGEKGKEKIEETGGTPKTEQPEGKGDADEGRSKEERTNMKLKDKGKLFVGGLNRATTSEGLKDYFSLFGSVVDAVVMRFPNSKNSRGYGFVTFANPVSADVALKMQSHVLDGKVIDIRAFESSRARRKKEARLYLGGLPPDTKKEDLRIFFSRYGKISDLVIPHNKTTKKPMGYAFLAFEEEEAAERCLSESFVHFGNQRVLIRKATARNGSAGTASDVEEGLECQESDGESSDGCEDDVASVPDEDNQSSASGDGASQLELFPGFMDVLKDYLQPKIALCNSQTPMEVREYDSKWQPSGKDVREMERLLTNFLRESARRGGETFSDEDATDGDDEDEDESEYDDEDDEDDEDESLLLEKTNVLEELNAKFREMLTRTISNETELPAMQKPTAPFTVKDEAGALRCQLCHWTPPDGSCETFLAHCNTAEHRMKIKERFMPEETQESKPANTSRDSIVISSKGAYNKAKQYKIHENVKQPKKLPEQQIQKKRQSETKLQQEPQQPKKKQSEPKLQQEPQQPRKKQSEPKLQQESQQAKKKQSEPKLQQEPQQAKKKQSEPKLQQEPQQPKKKQSEPKLQQEPQQPKKKQSEPKLQQEPQQQSQQKKNNNKQLQKQTPKSENPGGNVKLKDAGKIPNLKVHSLAKGMVCIQPLSPNELSCRMCNKVIPIASDFGTLMKNVSCHLQSKGHLKKLAETENHLKTALSKTPKEETDRSQQQATVTGKTGKGEQQGKNPKSGTVGNNREKTEKKTQSAAAAFPKVNFLCLFCSYYANTQNTASAHLGSKVHAETVNKANAKSPEFTLCKGCNRLLHGSLVDINKHHLKCLPKKQ